jgi:5'-phosphate synthase pdxT subunit
MSADDPVIGVLALQGDVREHLVALAGLGATARPVRRPAELDDIDGIVIPGGESTTICRLLDVFELREPLVRRLAGGLPAFGSCAGMIVLAGTILDGRADQVPLGAIDIVVRRNAFGRQVDSFETDLDVAGVPGGPVRAVFIRAPWVERAGPGVEVLARVGEHSVAVRQGRVLATSFHPEVSGDDRLHRLFLDMLTGTAS